MDQLGQNLINKNLDFTRFCGMTDPGTLGSCGGESKKKNKKLLRVYPNSYTNVTPEGPGLWYFFTYSTLVWEDGA